MKHRIVTLGAACLLAATTLLVPLSGSGASARQTLSGNTNSPCSLPLPVQATPVASPVAATPVAQADTAAGETEWVERLSGKIGGSLDSWYAMYGEGGAGSTDTVQTYLWKGCGPGTQATFANGVAVWVSLWAHRPEDIRAGRAHESDDQNWTQEDALTIAKRLLPPDVVLEAPFSTEKGNLKIHGTSAIMSEDIGWDTHGVAGVGSTPGEFEILLTLDPDGRVYELDVALRGYTIG